MLLRCYVRLHDITTVGPEMVAVVPLPQQALLLPHTTRQ
jgi:hypothetical protein